MIEYEYLSNNIDYNDAHQNECRFCGLSTIKVLLTTKNQMLPHVDHPPPPPIHTNTTTQSLHTPHTHHAYHTSTPLVTF